MRKSYTFSDSANIPQKKPKKSTDDKEENMNDKKKKIITNTATVQSMHLPSKEKP